MSVKKCVIKLCVELLPAKTDISPQNIE